MAIFLQRSDLYRLLQRELPPNNVYPDGPPDRFYSTADMDSVAEVLSKVYANLERIYDNYFPQSADESLNKWETKVYGSLNPQNLTVSERQDRLVTFIRNPKGLTVSDMISVVKGVIGSDKDVQIIEWGCSSGVWIIGVSELGEETYLGGPDQSQATGSDLCSKTWTDFNLTQQEWLELKDDAYRYEVLVYNYTLTAQELQLVEEALSAAEPARSGHTITDGLT